MKSFLLTRQIARAPLFPYTTLFRSVKRLSGFTRFFAKMLFGAGFMSRANWDDAVKNLERAVALNPRHIYHRLELAEVYGDIGQYAKAREQYDTIATLPIGDAMDDYYQRDADGPL